MGIIGRISHGVVGNLSELSSESSEESADVTSRQMDLLSQAFSALEDASPSDLVLAANAVRRAAQSIGEIIGKTYSDDLLDALLSRFCVGK